MDSSEQLCSLQVSSHFQLYPLMKQHQQRQQNPPQHKHLFQKMTTSLTQFHTPMKTISL